MQESINENSLFMGKSIMRGNIIKHSSIFINHNNLIEAKLYTITEIDPIFFMLRALRIGIRENQKRYQSLT